MNPKSTYIICEMGICSRREKKSMEKLVINDVRDT